MIDKEKDTVTIGKMILRQDELEIPVTYNDEIFTLQYPTPYMKAQIEADIARRLGGMTRAAFNPDYLATMEATAYVDALIIPNKSPNWFGSAWTCYDDDLIVNLYAGYLRFRKNFHQKIRDGESVGDSEGVSS